ncbi:MAG: hypothetical protein ACNA8N_15190 [Trueperaceae bacterium]
MVLASDSPPCDLVRIRPDASPFALWRYLHACARQGPGTAWESHVAAVRAAQGADAPCAPADSALAEEAEPRGADLGPGRVPVPGEPRKAASFDAAHDLACLLANAESEGIAVTWCEREVTLGGFVYRPPERQARRRDRRAPPAGLDARSLPAVTIGEFVVVLNPAQDWTTTLDVLLHEVAHVLLGHTGPRVPLGLGSLHVLRRRLPGHHTRELEAITAAVVAAWRRGHRPSMEMRQWTGHFVPARQGEELGAVDLRWVFCAADILAAWCRVPPDATSVRAVGRPRPSGSGPAVGARPFWRGAGRLPGSWDAGPDDEMGAVVARDRELVEAGR